MTRRFLIQLLTCRRNVREDDRTKEVETNPALAAQIAEHPKEELLRLLNSETAEPGTNVGGPFTVLFMDRKEVIKDYSDNHVCAVL
jgi:hypothetical protein